MSHGKSKPYRVEISDILGRYLVASRDIKPGEVILKESPLLVGPAVESAPICVGCYAPLAPTSHPYRCSRCRLAPLCGVVCEKCGDHSEGECDALRQIAEKAPETQTGLLNICRNYQVILPLRCLLLRSDAPAKWEPLLQLEAHMEERRGTPIWISHHETVVKVLQSWGLLTPADIDNDVVQRVCGILDVNSFEVRGPIVVGVPRGPETLRGVYLEAAMMAHDCIANTHLAVDDSFHMTIHASVPIPEGHPIYFNYTSTMQGTEQRREHLREGKYFECRCRRCCDPTELGTHMSSVLCARCPDGLVCKTSADVWTCVTCAHACPDPLVAATIAEARGLLDEVDRTSHRDMEALLKNLSRSLPANHAIVLELKQNLVALYRDVIAREPSSNRKILTRKIELCRELLPVLEIIEPGISRLRGITLYEIHVPIVLLANREYQSGEITSVQLLSRMKEAEGFLREAVTQLLYEPGNTPENQLARVAMQELKDLRASMLDVEKLHVDNKTSSGKKGKRNKKKS